MSTAPYTIRPAIPSDLNFIFSTWSKSYRYNSKLGRLCRNSIFFPAFQKVMDHLLGISPVNVASSDDGLTIYGYIVYQPPNILHYVYVKDAFAKLGIAWALLGASFQDVSQYTVTHLSDDGESILEAHPEFDFNPFYKGEK